MKITLLGGAEVVAPGAPPHPLEGQAALVVAYLALEGPCTRQGLAGLLWPEVREAQARNNLRQLLWRMRQRRTAACIEGADPLRLASSATVDVLRLHQAAAQRDWAGVVALPGGLLAGTPLNEGCEALEEWLARQRLRLQRLREQAHEALAAEAEREGRLDEALEHARQRIALDDTHEEGHRLLMRLLYQVGDPAAALAAYQECQWVLQRQLGASPSPATRRLAEELRQGAQAAHPPRARPPPLPLSVVHPPVLAGREREWARMEEAWAARKHLFVLGAAGVGKSRLMADFARAKGRSVLLSARPGDAQVPYASYTRIVRTLLAQERTAPLERWVRLELARLVPELQDGGPRPAPPEAGATFHDALVHFFRRALRDVDFLLYEDAHYMDRHSVALGPVLVSSLEEEVAAGRFPILLASHRPGELADSDFHVSAMEDAGLGQLIPVPPLTEPEVETMLRGMGVPALERVGAAMARYTGGNPLFIVETAKHLLESEDFRGDFPESLPPPGRADSIIGKRLARLSPEALRLAHVLAVTRTDFDFALAARALGMSLDDLVRPWRELTAAHLVRGHWFSHDLVAEALLANLPPALRRALRDNLLANHAGVGPSSPRLQPS